MEVILYSKECNWYTRCCPLNGGVRYRECPLREAILCCRFVPIGTLQNDLIIKVHVLHDIIH